MTRLLHLGLIGGSIAIALCTLSAQAAALESSLRPFPRPSVSQGEGAIIASPPEALPPKSTPSGTLSQTSVAVLAALVPVFPTVRPLSRPVSAQIVAASARSGNSPVWGPDLSLRPAVRPDSVAEQAWFKRRKLRKGSVCGDVEIQGKTVGSVAATLPGCGAKNAVRVTSIAGVALSQESLMVCDTAKALKRWISNDVEKAFGRHNRVVTLRVAAHYACRTRNNRPGAKISEHGRGKAIDISGFKLEDGTVITVLEGWQRRSTRKRLAKIWKAACGPFGTVLGPEADRHHRDHFHLDVARHRGGSYCR